MVMIRLQEQLKQQQLMMAASAHQKQNGGEGGGGEEGPGGVQSKMDPEAGGQPTVGEGETQMPTEEGP